MRTAGRSPQTIGFFGLFAVALVSGPVGHEPDPPEIYRFDLVATARAPGAIGTGLLNLAWSPFGVAVSADGFLVYDLALTVERVIEPQRLGPFTTYVAWIATPSLDKIEKLGFLSAAGKLETQIASWNKFIVLVTAEASTDVERRTGPVVLQGRSPSGFIASFQSHELFNLMPH